MYISEDGIKGAISATVRFQDSEDGVPTNVIYSNNYLNSARWRVQSYTSHFSGYNTALIGMEFDDYPNFIQFGISTSFMKTNKVRDFHPVFEEVRWNNLKIFSTLALIDVIAQGRQNFKPLSLYS